MAEIPDLGPLVDPDEWLPAEIRVRKESTPIDVSHDAALKRAIDYPAALQNGTCPYCPYIHVGVDISNRDQNEVKVKDMEKVVTNNRAANVPRGQILDILHMLHLDNFDGVPFNPAWAYEHFFVEMATPTSIQDEVAANAAAISREMAADGALKFNLDGREMWDLKALRVWQSISNVATRRYS